MGLILLCWTRSKNNFRQRRLPNKHAVPIPRHGGPNTCTKHFSTRIIRPSFVGGHFLGLQQGRRRRGYLASTNPLLESVSDRIPRCVSPTRLTIECKLERTKQWNFDWKDSLESLSRSSCISFCRGPVRPART